MAKSICSVTFEAKLHRPADGGDWMFVFLPQEASDSMPARGMVAVEGVVNGVGVAGMLQPDNRGGHWLKVEPQWFEGSRVSSGDMLRFEIAPAKVEPEPEVPELLATALANSPVAMATWTRTSTIARRDWITWLNQGKREETRQIRLEKMLDMLSKGKPRVCCFDRSGMASKAFHCPVPAGD